MIRIVFLKSCTQVLLQAANLLGVSRSRVRWLLKEGRIKGAFKISKVWAIPLFDGMPVISRGRRGPKPRWRKCPEIAVTKIYVNRNEIASNYKRGKRKPVISVNRSGVNACGHEVIISGPCRIIYQPDIAKSPRLWIETLSQVEVICFDENNATSTRRAVGSQFP